MSEVTKKEHMEFAKARALAYCDTQDFGKAYTSIVSDLKMHPETKDHGGIMVGMQLLIIGELSTPEKMRRFIEDFN